MSGGVGQGRGNGSQVACLILNTYELLTVCEVNMAIHLSSIYLFGPRHIQGLSLYLNQGQYPAILTDKARSTKDLLLFVLKRFHVC